LAHSRTSGEGDSRGSPTSGVPPTESSSESYRIKLLSPLARLGVASVGMALAGGLYADLEPAWSPDGRKLAFVTDRFSTDLRTLSPGNYRLALIDPFTDSITALPSFPEGKNIDPQWSPDGASIYFLSDRTGITNIYKLDVATGPVLADLHRLLGRQPRPVPAVAQPRGARLRRRRAAADPDRDRRHRRRLHAHVDDLGGDMPGLEADGVFGPQRPHQGDAFKNQFLHELHPDIGVCLLKRFHDGFPPAILG
jgi:dipeptidyl aminopeptidase/acylaminoacyl peptidase